ncbi:uncharacterized protein F4807DRAFT_20931 [Annulohypoxylon truncatum]|uniref:uncharacterized protein n=1 Tax=Annulohypoxylon truncatum TaxID=327061 RepID=UPI00200721ED|nr:uncharacterized protein F4807DRAFT_20931 [Annulohypoxylon truncatum]KAI1215105.1 hypothetical protein F4807DRAFT_20931 [Annulohypoxylon truncatum]
MLVAFPNSRLSYLCTYVLAVNTLSSAGERRDWKKLPTYVAGRERGGFGLPYLNQQALPSARENIPKRGRAPKIPIRYLP